MLSFMATFTQIGSCRSFRSSKLLRQTSLQLPEFLIPAFASARVRPFSITPPCASRIGEAPLSLPSDVKLTIVEPQQRSKQVTRIEPLRTVEIHGKLGRFNFS